METVIILILVALDQWTKGLAERLIGETGHVTVIPHFFELRLTYNKGAASYE
jgi:lipoprotein signal peptidase